MYNLQASISDPQQFVIYELFRSDEALEWHRKAKHVLDFLSEVQPILIPGQFTLVKLDHVDLD